MVNNMQKYKMAAISIAFLAIVLSGGLTAGIVSADDGEEGRYSLSREERILTAFENNDYDTWKKIVSGKRSAYNVITREDFGRFVAARQAVRAGEYDRAIILAERVENDLKNKLGAEYFV
jgi:hypothetical protein